MTSSKNDYNSDSFQKFLDEQQYNKNGILRYEMIFGETYVSTGGQETTTKFCNDLDLKVRHTPKVQSLNKGRTPNGRVICECWMSAAALADLLSTSPASTGCW